MTLLTLERKLRNGETPESLGMKELGNGVQKTAYLIKCDVRDYVVKKNTGAYNGGCGNGKKICPNLQRFGIIRVIQKQVGEWLIQEMTTPLCKIAYDSQVWKLYESFINAEDRPRGDYHAGNFGVTKSGRLVCFDW